MALLRIKRPDQSQRRRPLDRALEVKTRRRRLTHRLRLWQPQLEPSRFRRRSPVARARRRILGVSFVASAATRIATLVAAVDLRVHGGLCALFTTPGAASAPRATSHYARSACRLVEETCSPNQREGRGYRARREAARGRDSSATNGRAIWPRSPTGSSPLVVLQTGEGE
jgi:hypothetical protein